MRTPASVAIIAALLLGCITSGAIASDTKGQPQRAPIREFAPEVAARLGRAIYEQDKLAWVATDVLLAKKSEAELRAEGAAGWVVDVSAQAALVRFVRKQGDTIEAAHDIVFRRGEKPELVVPENRTMTESQIAQWRAVETARTAVFGARRPWCGGNPNFVVLHDPEHAGLLVYILRAKPSARKIPVGGHYRISVTADGQTATQVDQLFVSCLTMDRQDAGGGSVAAMVMNQIVSAKPLETHVFLSLQEKLPFNVVTPDGIMWEIKDGTVKQSGSVHAPN